MTFWNIVGFILTLAILVGIHEWAHFAVARAFNVKIERFSLGFGKALCSWRGKKDHTEYRIGWIPLGGYVAMAGENAEESASLSPEERARTFVAQAAWKRFLIAFAGPASNLIFAVLAFAALYMVGVGGLRPEIEYVRADSLAAAAELHADDRIVQIGHHSVRLDNDAQTALIAGMFESALPVRIQRGNQILEKHLDLSALRAGDELDLAQATGLYLRGQWLPARIAAIIPDSAAEAMGLQAGDEILSINGENVDLIRMRSHLPAAHEALQLSVLRGDNILNFSGKMGEKDGKALLGVRWQPWPIDDYWQVERYPFGEALQRGLAKMSHYFHLTAQMLARIVKQQASLDNLGGPLTLGDMAGKTLKFGWESFLNFLGVVSLSLALFNLLPIPVLDGGHMLLCAIEMLRGKALSQRSIRILNYAGAALLYAFMFLLLGRDLWKYLL